MFRFAVVIVDRAEGNGEVGTQWQTTYAVPLDMTLREAVKQMFGEPAVWPRGRVTLTKHLTRRHYAKTYIKCGLNERNWTGGPGSDIRVKDAACKFWEPHPPSLPQQTES